MPVRLMVAYGLMMLIAIGLVVMVLSIRYHSLPKRQERARELARRKQVAHEGALAARDESR